MHWEKKNLVGMYLTENFEDDEHLTNENEDNYELGRGRLIYIVSSYFKNFLNWLQDWFDKVLKKKHALLNYSL